VKKVYHWESVPRRVRDHMQELVYGLQKAAEDDLVGVIVHGSAARGDFESDHSDVDVVIVLARSSRAVLERMGNALALGRSSARIEAMILVEPEIARAADVFPLFYEEIKAFHAVIFGRDPFADLVISTEHRRLRIEQELREIQIRLRRAVTDARGDRGPVLGAIKRKTKQLSFPLRALLGLLGVETKHRIDIVFARAGKHFKLDVAPILRADEDPDAAHDALVLLLDRAIEAADRLDPDPDAPSISRKEA
jgi:predicted nucleotidyltransferase